MATRRTKSCTSGRAKVSRRSRNTKTSRWLSSTWLTLSTVVGARTPITVISLHRVHSFFLPRHIGYRNCSWRAYIFKIALLANGTSFIHRRQQSMTARVKSFSIEPAPITPPADAAYTLTVRRYARALSCGTVCVCPTQAGILTKWLNIGIFKQHRTISRGLYGFFEARDLAEIRMGLLQRGRQIQAGQVEIGDFGPISRYISEMMRDGGMLTMEG